MKSQFFQMVTDVAIKVAKERAVREVTLQRMTLRQRNIEAALDRLMPTLMDKIMKAAARGDNHVEIPWQYNFEEITTALKSRPDFAGFKIDHSSNYDLDKFNRFTHYIYVEWPNTEMAPELDTPSA